MPFFTNHTRNNAILTLKVTGADKGTVMIGVGSAQGKTDLPIGYHDLLVPAGASLEFAEGTEAVFISIRTAP